ncbi:MAG: zeta toxin family protein [Acidobacteriota bacterium]|nr:zeta toxin family protein [Acidobacteriota bacterium]
MNLLEFTPRLRMFAGPNGSGKSTIKSVIRRELLGVYVNPDEIEAVIKQFDFLDLGEFEVQTDEAEILEFFKSSTLLEKADLLDEAEHLRFIGNRLSFQDVSVNSYLASVAADFIRQKLILTRKSFSFETVMSAPDKVRLLEKSRQIGYRNYLYFVATDNPEINISRVKYRVETGGHDVPKDKITTRYFRSLGLLWEAVKFTNRAYIFDNSGSELLLLAEITDAEQLEIKSDSVPLWFEKYVLGKMK